MKRLFAGTALAAVLATGAFAATEEEMTAIQEYAPNVDVSTMSEQQIDAVMNVIHGSDSEGEKSAKILALVGEAGDNTVVSEVSSGQLARLQQYAPELDFTGITASELEQALNLIDSADSKGEALAQLRNYSTNSVSEAPSAAPFTEAELSQIAAAAPDLDPMTLSVEQRAELQAALATGDSEEIMRVTDSF
ncbi:hypothetical protein JYP51_13075 [Ponticoccus gilvus]|nr:hypothetical protein [Enemella evansiae]